MKAPRLLKRAIDQLLRDAVTLEVEEADRLADLAQLRRGRFAATRLAAEVSRDVKGRNFLVGVRMVHQMDGFVVVAQIATNVASFGGFGFLRAQFHRLALNRRNWRLDNR